MNALNYDLITISVLDALAIESRARPWDNQLSFFVLKEFFRVLAEGGILFLIVKGRPDENSRRYEKGSRFGPDQSQLQGPPLDWFIRKLIQCHIGA